MATENEIRIARADWLRKAEGTLRDPFSKTTRDRQKQLLLSSAFCILASSSQISLVKGTRISIFQVGNTQTWGIYAGLGIVTVYLLIAFYVGARPEATVDFYRTQSFLRDARQKWIGLQTDVLNLAKIIGERSAKRLELMKDLLDRQKVHVEEWRNDADSSRLMSERRLALQQQLRELEPKRPSDEDEESHSLWLNKVNALHREIRQNLDAEIDQERSRHLKDTLDNALEDALVQGNAAIDEGRAELDLSSLQRQVAAMDDLLKTFQEVARIRKLRLRVEVVGPILFASLSLLLLLISSLGPSFVRFLHNSVIQG
jgi:hypothetical protein